MLLMITGPTFLNAQITTPVIRANFGVDADLRSNFFNGAVQSGNDDFFMLPGSLGTGQFVIDTAGAAAINARYAADPAFRRLPFYRTMRFPAYTVVNNRLLIDAVYIRDYHGDDSTIFASGSNKNGMSPASWSCPVSQSIPDKNEILDMMVHVRRAGPNPTDSLWMFGGVSIENTTGNRYFDFEMYQTDIYYDRVSRQFYNYGPDAGHTSWTFDASGNIRKPGDIIFTAEYGSSTLTNLEARIWVSKADWQTVVPNAFTWSGSFDGDGTSATFGYAGILPKTAGAFYTGLQSANNTWAGPFQLVLGNNSVVPNYSARQYMELSVNLTKLGLDPVTLLGGNSCGMPFRRILVKSRASTSFTSELKDFIGPFDFFLAPRAEIITETPRICDTGMVAEIHVVNPVPTSVYQWSTPNGRIISVPTGPSIYVDTPGVYIVTQYLQAGCSAYARDTVTIQSFGICYVMAQQRLHLEARYDNGQAQLRWRTPQNELARTFFVERSTDGRNFEMAGTLEARGGNGEAEYLFTDRTPLPAGPVLFYRVREWQTEGRYLLSPVAKLSLAGATVTAEVYPNPSRSQFTIRLFADAVSRVEWSLLDLSGKNVYHTITALRQGWNEWTTPAWEGLPRGVYYLRLSYGDQVYSKRVLLVP